MITLIAAITNTNAIGRDGKLIVRNSEDLKNFKKLTLGKTVIGGRKTFDEIGGPLQGRLNIVISNARPISYVSEGDPTTQVVLTKELIRVLEEHKSSGIEAFVIGGQSIYKQALDSGLVDICIITRFFQNNEYGDVYLPPLNEYGFSKSYMVLSPNDEMTIEYYKK